MSFSFNKKSTDTNDFFRYSEWLESDGFGGWASSTLSGAHSRRYHGLLVRSLKPPVERQVLLSKLDETIIQGDSRYDLSCNHYVNRSDMEGLDYLEEFRKDLFPQWIYKIETDKGSPSNAGARNTEDAKTDAPSSNSIILRKTVSVIPEGNFTLVEYHLNSKLPILLELHPLVAGRDCHSLTYENEVICKDAAIDKNGLFSFQPYGPGTRFFIYNPSLSFSPQPIWYKNLFYRAEQERGQDCVEDLFLPGILQLPIKPNETVSLLISGSNPCSIDYKKLFSAEKTRRLGLVKDLAVDDFSSDLLLAADQFIVRTSEKRKTVIAGYPWFSDWGRDTMIALPGLCLVSRRFEEAKSILRNFANYLHDGIIPNLFPENGHIPEYNTCDATLWFFVACYRYTLESKDTSFISEEMLPIFKSIIDWHQKGTLFNIHVEQDGLLYAGQEGLQLTWMDAKVDNWVVTPRTGKPVEINALWFNCLMIYAKALELSGKNSEAQRTHTQAQQVKEHFNLQFWNKQEGYLYDVIDGDLKDASFRPNQLLALSLPFPLLQVDKAKKVMELTKERLLTTRGLRSLSAGSPGYRAYYFGDRVERDGAYHQGTVWSWLLGPYIDALIYVYEDAGKTEAKALIQEFKPHLSEAGIGSISEIFDASEPFYPKGCIAQAWGVAEVLRVYLQYKLYK